MDEENKVSKTERELWSALDRAVFGRNSPDLLKGTIEAMKSQLDRERSSLGRYLESLRRQLELSPEEMALRIGVKLSVWKDWESDFGTPSREEMESLLRTMRWEGRYFERILWKLWDDAKRFRLKRLTTFRSEFLAARGVSSEAGIAWQSVGPEIQKKIVAWGHAHGHAFPVHLTEFLASLETDEEKEAWIEDVLGSIP